MSRDDIIKRAFIAGAAIALSYKEKHPHADESEVLSHATREMRNLIKEIEEDDS